MKKILTLFLLFFFASLGETRAEVVTIGTGSNTGQNTFPVKTDWNYFLTQQIFTADEVGMSGAINAISFNYTNSGGAFSMSDIQMYMKHVSTTQFYNSSDMVMVSPSDKVFEGTFSASGAGWVTINLDTPFHYDGNSNLLICFYTPVANFVCSNSDMFYYTNTYTYTEANTEENIYSSMALYCSSYFDFTNIDYTYVAWSHYNFRANIQIDITPPAAIPYTYDFEDAAPFADWNALTGNSNIGNYIQYPHSGTHYLTFGGSTSNIVVLPQFAAPTNTLFLKFWTRPEHNGDACGDFAVGYMTDPSDASTFVALETYSHSDWTSDFTYEEKIVYFDNAPANSRMAMRQYNCSSAWYWFVDDVKVNTIPTCPEPFNAHIVEGSLIPNGVTIDWNYNSGDLVQYFMQQSEFYNPENMLWSNSMYAGPLTWGTLIPNTDYTFGLRRYCSESDQSDPVIFTLHTPALVPFIEPFATTSIPEGWTRYSALVDNVMNSTAQLSPVNGYWIFGQKNGAFNNDNHAYINIYGADRKHWLVTPVVHIENDCELSFELALTQYYGTMQPVDPTLQPDDRFVVLASTDNGKNWTILREWNNTGSTYVYNDISVDGEDVVIDLAAYQGTNLMVAFYGESTVANNGDNNLHINDVSIRHIPTCRKPTNVEAFVSNYFATFTWDAPENQIRWDVSINWPENGDYPREFTVYEPSFTITKEQLDEILNADCYGEPFTFYVQGYCGSEDGWSDSSEEVEFTLLPPSLTVYDSTATSNTIPAYIFYFDDFTKSQFVIPADDLVEMLGASITSMTFYTNYTNIPYTTVSPADVFLKEVNYTSISAFESQSSATNVYSGFFDIVSTGNSGQMTINFSTPYTYQGGNLFVGIENTDDLGYKNIYFYGKNVDGASISGSNGSSLDNVQPTQRNFIPKTTFTYLDPCTPKSLPYSYGFEDPDEFDCWTKLNCHTDSDINNDDTYEGDNSFRFRWTTNPPQYLISPKFDVAVDMKVSFYYKNGSNSWPETFQVGYSTTTKSPSAFVWGEEVTANDQYTWQLYEEIFPAGTRYVAVKLNSNDKLYLYLDNFSFETYLCPDEQQCELTFTLTDSYGDTWNGNAIRVVDVQTNTVLAIMTNDYDNYDATGSSGTYTQTKTLPVCDGRELRFEWVSGQWPGECSYTVTDNNGSVVFTGSNVMSEAVHYTINCSQQSVFITDGYWNDGDNWNTGEVPEEGSDVIIQADVVIPAGYTAYAIDVVLDGGSITVEDGGQLWHRTDDLVVTMKKNIVGYGDANNQNNYYLLAFPFNENLPVPAEMTAPGCDLYMFNENYPDAEWRNNRDTPINELQAIYGYLFASPDDLELSLTGSAVLSGSYSYTMTYSENPNNISNGWRLFGNILTCDVYIYSKDNNDQEYTPMNVMFYNEEGEMETLLAGPIPPMSAFFIKVTETTNIIFSYYPRSNVRPAGALKGKFTMNSNGDQVRFSQGNLQYIGSASTPYWKFADKQWETLGDNGQGSTSQNVDRDLFGWGTSGYDHGAVCYQPWSTSQTDSDYFAYGNRYYELYNSTGQADWGYNAIRNGGNQENSGWRTLTIDEWTYILNGRSTESGIRFVLGNVNGVDGVILLPDNWSTSTYTLTGANNDYGNFMNNIISATDWTTILEANGAVFLPKTVSREGTSITTDCNYWSSTHSSASYSYCIYIAGYIDFNSTVNNRSTGNVVRLVNPVNN